MIYEVGNTYDVPVAFGDFTGEYGFRLFRKNKDGEMLVPVITPAHEDFEIIKFPERHYHYNLQFMPSAWFKMVTIESRFAEKNSEAYAYVLYHWQAEPRIETMKMRCLREAPVFPHFPAQSKWPQLLKDKYQGQCLRNGHICPHRGADLRRIKPDELGRRTCPCHGLVFDAAGVCLGNESITSPSDGAKKH